MNYFKMSEIEQMKLWQLTLSNFDFDLNKCVVIEDDDIGKTYIITLESNNDDFPTDSFSLLVNSIDHGIQCYCKFSIVFEVINCGEITLIDVIKRCRVGKLK